MSSNLETDSSSLHVVAWENQHAHEIGSLNCTRRKGPTLTNALPRISIRFEHRGSRESMRAASLREDLSHGLRQNIPQKGLTHC